MTVNSLLSFTSALLCGVLAVYVLLNDARSFVRRAFALAMAGLAIEQLFVGLSSRAFLPADLLYWQRMRIVAFAFVPGSWLLFSLSYARSGYAEFVARWKWIVVTAFTLPVLIAIVSNAAIFPNVLRLHVDSDWRVELSLAGRVFYILALLIFTLVLANLERTLRASYGAKRWQIKFMVLGLGCYVAFRIYTATQAVLYSSLDSTWQLTNSAALLVGCLLMILSLYRSERFDLDIYLSNTFVYGSVTVLVVGLYLLLLGVFSALFVYFTGDQFLSLLVFFVFLALVALSVLLFSAKTRQEVIIQINRHLKRSPHDYRQVWTDFSQRTARVTEARSLCATVANFVAETFGVPSVSVWLAVESPERIVLGGSTTFTIGQGGHLKDVEKAAARLFRSMGADELPVDFGAAHPGLPEDLRSDYPDFFRQTQIRYCVPLTANRRVLGILTVSDRLTKQDLSNQDLDLLKTIADQAANALLNRKLSEDLLQAKELEAFQTMSAFFVHDLKNLAGSLSLMSRNLLAHLDKPEFRHDALTMLSRSVDRITELCERITQWNTAGEHRRVAVDLNELVSATLKTFDGSLEASLVVGLQTLPKLSIYPEQLQKVLVNLILNANEAAGAGGEIRVSTSHDNGQVCLSVVDNGCGMSREFIARHLFRPFQTSKKHGLGIGLYQCKQIVEADGGRIEVESEEGKGSTFRVLIPVGTTADR
jgi:putative PEP-CTERM system histidine kinase